MSSDRVVREVEFPTGDGVIRGKIAVSTGPLRLSDLAPTAFELTNALVRRATELVVLQGESISCRAGCGACCRHMVPLSPPEAFFLMDVIDAFEPARRAAVMMRFDAIVDRLAARGLIADLLNPPADDGEVLPVARKYFELEQLCPFLVDESCSIHPHRPIACRDYSVTSPAAWCASPYDHEIAKMPMPLPLSVPLARVAAAMTGIDPCLVPLTLTPRWVGEHADLRNRTWPGLELFDRLLAEIKRDQA